MHRSSRDQCFLGELIFHGVSEQKTSIYQFEIFEGDWESERSQLAKIYYHYSSGTSLPYRMKERDKIETAEYLSPED